MGRPRDPVTGQFLPSGGGKKGGGGGQRRQYPYWQHYGGPPPPQQRRRRSGGGGGFSFEDILEGTLYSVGLDVVGDMLDQRGTSIPLGLSGREAAGAGALWYGRKKRSKKWFIAGLLNTAPAIKNLAGGVAGGFLGTAGALPAAPAAPQLPAAPAAPAEEGGGLLDTLKEGAEFFGGEAAIGELLGMFGL